MRSRKKIPVLVSVVLLLTTVSPAYSQNLAYSLLGHERQIGPLEQCLYSYQWSSFQRTAVGPWAAQSDTSMQEQPSIVWPVVGGVIGGVGCIGIAALIAYSTFRTEGWFISEADEAFIIGALILEPIGVGIGVHLGNGCKGKLGYVTGVSYLVGLTGVGLSIATKEKGSTLIIATEILQLLSAVAVERATAAVPSNNPVCIEPQRVTRILPLLFQAPIHLPFGIAGDTPAWDCQDPGSSFPLTFRLLGVEWCS